jgi:hypothetical protein
VEVYGQLGAVEFSSIQRAAETSWLNATIRLSTTMRMAQHPMYFRAVVAGATLLIGCACGTHRSEGDRAVVAAPDDGPRWWPLQTVPQTLVQVNPSSPSVDMMVQSIAGLAAKSVNEGRGTEMVWVRTDDTDVVDWLARRQHRDPRFTMRETFEPWDLVARYVRQGLIKGYILYRADRSKGEINAHRAGMDCSVNVATSLAGVLGGIIIDEELEVAAKAHGLPLLMDVRDKDQAWCFRAYRDRFNRRMAVTQDPRKPNLRDLAIAQTAFTAYGYDEPVPSLMK